MPAEKRRDTKTKNPHGKACPGNNQYRSVSSFLLVVLPREKRVGIRSFLQAGTVKENDFGPHQNGAFRAVFLPRGCAAIQRPEGAKKPRRKACSTRRESVLSGAWGDPNKQRRDIQKDIAVHCLHTFYESPPGTSCGFGNFFCFRMVDSLTCIPVCAII